MNKRISLFVLLTLALTNFQLWGQGNYKNFKASIYTRAYEVQKMEDAHWLDSTWQVISSQMDVDKIYLETHRDLLIVDQKVLKRAKAFFKKKGVEVAGGITYTINERNLFQTFCYTKEEDRKKVQEIIEYTAANFDEVVLDDFFFTNCKCEKCVEAKGDRSWSEYRLELMTDAAKNLIMGPAKKVNPDVKVIIKYPNWYDHFPEMGFNLETQPAIFDGLYTGTETRDAVLSEQHLQPYLGYLVFRYYNNLKPGKNGGGWVDTGGMNSYDRYAEQLWITIFAKAPEMTMFDYRQMLYAHNDRFLPAWTDQETSFDYDSFLPVNEKNTIAKAAGHSLKIVDEIAGELGNPVGIKSYKPYHSRGEDFLENYLGMIGIPMDLVQEFPMDDDMLLLTEHAKWDPDIVEKIKQRLLQGKDVMITSGLVDALQDRGLRELVNLEYTSRKSLVSEFMLRRHIVKSDTPILIPQIQYNTNDSWEMISGMDGGLGWPLLHFARVAGANLYMLTIPENFADLYNLPDEVLNSIRSTICQPLGLSIQGRSKVSMFLYDNNTMILESFNDEPVEIEVMLPEYTTSVTDLSSGKKLELVPVPVYGFRRGAAPSERYSCKVSIPVHSFKGLRLETK